MSVDYAGEVLAKLDHATEDDMRAALAIAMRHVREAERHAAAFSVTDWRRDRAGGMVTVAAMLSGCLDQVRVS